MVSNRRKQKIKVRYLALAMVLGCATVGSIVRGIPTWAEGCPQLRVVFARGSGGERWKDQNYLAYKEAIERKLATTGISYEFIDLDYPAVGVGADKLETTLGAFFGAGEAYEFGDSVALGVKNLKKMINGSSCRDTKYVVGGYSQGAMVASKVLSDLQAERLIYAATFGDPKIYLPEGKGVIPAACKGANLSDYRMYVPDCQAYKGLLGAHVSYEPEALVGKVGVWCNKRDIFCSSRLSVSDHVAYVADNLYEDASRVIFDKITKTFGIENHVSSPHDTAILIDSTGSMAGMLENYKAEALRLARETLNSGGRVALYDYRDLDDPYTPVEHCDFESCTLQVVEEELAGITVDGGGDTPESLLSASLHVMSSLKWKYGSTKSLVVLTDANFLSPDRDGVSFDEVVRLSKQIDPVNFYIITDANYGEDYVDLAKATDGRVVTNFAELSLLTDYIMERYDSLPRVEEVKPASELPTLTIGEVTTQGDTASVRFSHNGERALVILNDKILGVTDQAEITLNGLDTTTSNTLTLVPMNEQARGEAVSVELESSGVDTGRADELGDSCEELATDCDDKFHIRAPKTGRR